MNSPFVQERAAALAKRIRNEAGSNDETMIHHIFRLCFGRPARPDEEARTLAFFAADQETQSGSQESDSQADVLTRFCQAMLCTAEFRNLD